MNAGKTKYMSYTQHESVTIKTNDGSILEEVGNFKYLGAWMHSKERDVKQRKAAAWRASSKLTKIWKSSLSRPLNLRLFAATVEWVFFYGCEALTLTPKLAKEIDGCYTRMLRTALNVHCKQQITNKELFGELPKLSEKIRQKRLRFASHCSRSQQEPVSKLLHWTPKHGRRKPGRPALYYSDIYLFIYLFIYNIRRIARLFPTVHYALNLRDAARNERNMERRYDFRCRRKPKCSEKTCAGKYGSRTKFTYDSDPTGNRTRAALVKGTGTTAAPTCPPQVGAGTQDCNEGQEDLESHNSSRTPLDISEVK